MTIASHPFYFDRQTTAPFALPAGYCFVITDVFVNPEVTSFGSGQFFLVSITVDGARSITVRSDGHTTHLPLTAGLVAPDPNLPGFHGLDARNTTFSTGPVEIQLLGYFIKKSKSLGVGIAFTP